RLAAIQVDHLRRHTRVGQLLGEHYGGVAGAAAGNQRPEGLGPVPRPGEEVVVDLLDPARRAEDQAPGFVGGVAGRVGEGFVLGGERLAGRVGKRLARHRIDSTTLPVALRVLSRVNAVAASSSGSTCDTWGLSRPSRYQAKSCPNCSVTSSGACLRYEPQ